MKIVWVAGRLCEGTDWELIGVFETEDAANAACSRRSDFIGPTTLNEVLGGEPQPWPGAYYPRRTDEG